MAREKPKPDVQDALYLINLRRERSRLFLHEIMIGLAQGIAINIKPIQMLDYLTNLIMCIEMMLKLLSEDWGSHSVGPMYKKITGEVYPNQALMTSLMHATMDQKYLLSPAAGIVEHIPELEELSDFLYKKVKETHGSFSIWIDDTLPENFGRYLLDNAEKLYRGNVKSKPPGMDHSEWMGDLARAYREDVERIRRNLRVFLEKGSRFSLSTLQVSTLT